MADGEGGFVVKADPDAASTAHVSSEDASTASWSQIKDWLINPALGDPQSVQTASDHAGTIKRSLAEAMRRLVDVHEISQQKIKGRTSEAFEAAVAGFHSTIAASYDAMVGMPTGLGDYQYVLGDLARAYQYGRNEAEWIIDFYARQAVDVFGAQSSDEGGQTVVDVTTTLDPAKGQQILALMTADLQLVMRQVDEAYRHRTSSLTQPGAPVQVPVSPQSTTPSIPSGGGGGAPPRPLGAGGAVGGGISPVSRGSGDLPVRDNPGGPDRSAVPLPTPVGRSPERLPSLDPSTPGGGAGEIPSPAPLTPLPIASGAGGGAGLSPSRSPGTDGGAGVVGSGSGTGLGAGAGGAPPVAPLAIGGPIPRAADRAGLGGPALGGRSGASGAGGVAASGLGSGVPLAVPLSPSAAAARGGAVPSVTASGAGSGAGGLPFAPMGAGGAGGAGAGGAAARRARGGATSAFPGVGGPTLRPAAAPGAVSAVPTSLTVGTTPVAHAAAGAGGGGGSGMPFMPMGGGSGGAGAGAGGNSRSRRSGAELQPFPGLAVDPTLRPAPPLVAAGPTSATPDAAAAPDPSPARPSAAGAPPAPAPDAERVTVAPPTPVLSSVAPSAAAADPDARSPGSADGPPVAFLAGSWPGAGTAAAGAGPAPVSGATQASRAAPGGTGTAAAPITGPSVSVPVPVDAPVPPLPAGHLDTGADAGGPPSLADGAAAGLLVPLGPLRPRKRAERRRAAAEPTGDGDRADSTGVPGVIEIPGPGTSSPDGPAPDAADPDGSGPGGPGPDGVELDGGPPGIGGPDAGKGDAHA